MSQKEIMYLEYGKAQDSAEHHDSLVWITTSVILGASVVLIGVVLDYISKNQFNPIIATAISSLGLILILFQIYLQRGFRHARNYKYEECKRIEKDLNKILAEEASTYRVGQHLNFIWKDNQTLYYRIILFSFSFSYIVVIIIAWL